MNALLTEIILSHPCSTLAHLYLDWDPQPGEYIDVEGQTYLVLERRTRYLLQAERYQPDKIALYVQTMSHVAEKRLFNGQWVIGDVTCQFNAQSEVLRCAVNPRGPCDSCADYQRQ